MVDRRGRRASIGCSARGSAGLDLEGSAGGRSRCSIGMLGGLDLRVRGGRFGGAGGGSIGGRRGSTWRGWRVVVQGSLARAIGRARRGPDRGAPRGLWARPRGALAGPSPRAETGCQAEAIEGASAGSDPGASRGRSAWAKPPSRPRPPRSISRPFPRPALQGGDRSFAGHTDVSSGTPQRVPCALRRFPAIGAQAEVEGWRERWLAAHPAWRDRIRAPGPGRGLNRVAARGLSGTRRAQVCGSAEPPLLGRRSPKAECDRWKKVRKLRENRSWAGRPRH